MPCTLQVHKVLRAMRDAEMHQRLFVRCINVARRNATSPPEILVQASFKGKNLGDAGSWVRMMHGEEGRLPMLIFHWACIQHIVEYSLLLEPQGPPFLVAQHSHAKRERSSGILHNSIAEKMPVSSGLRDAYTDLAARMLASGHALAPKNERISCFKYFVDGLGYGSRHSSVLSFACTLEEAMRVKQMVDEEYWRRKMAAFAMGFHPRLGQQSLVYQLDDGLAMAIWAQLEKCLQSDEQQYANGLTWLQIVEEELQPVP